MEKTKSIVNLGAIHRLLLIMLRTKAGDSKSVQLSKKELCEMTRLSQGAIFNAVKDLERHGLIEVDRSVGKGNKNVYHLLSGDETIEKWLKIGEE